MSPHPSKRGSIYLIVLSTTVLVTSIALLGVEAQRNTARSVELIVNSSKARANCQSAFETALQQLTTTSNWRSKLNSGSAAFEYTDSSGNTQKVIVTDPVDGNLADDQWEDIVLSSTATQNGATQSFSVQLKPVVDPDPALAYGLYSAGTITFESVTFSSNRAIYSRGNVIASASSVYSPVGSSGTISGSTYYGSNRTNLPLERATDPAVISQWESRGTVINASDIPSRQIRTVALGPGLNPYGSKTTNASGIYVIDCQNGSLTISNCRIVATLIIKNCTSLKFSGSVSIQSPSSTQPTLLVDGSADIELSNTDLGELTNLTNFNPSGVPNSGITDIDTLDTYPSRINGLMYITGALRIAGTSRLIGVVICGSDVKIASNVGLQYSSGFYNDPPSGFKQSGGFAIVNGTIVQNAR